MKKQFWTPERTAIAAQCKAAGTTLTHEVGTEIWRIYRGNPDVDFFSPLLFWTYELLAIQNFLTNYKP